MTGARHQRSRPSKLGMDGENVSAGLFINALPALKIATS